MLVPVHVQLAGDLFDIPGHQMCMKKLAKAMYMPCLVVKQEADLLCVPRSSLRSLLMRFT